MESWVSRSVLKTNLGKKDGTLQGGMWEPHSASNCRGTQITSLRGCGWYHGGWGGVWAMRPAEKNKAVGAVYR
jgi:hypothetical protein